MEYLCHKKQKPKAGQLCLVKCPGWSNLEYIVAKWTGKRFDFPDNDSPNFLRWVKGYLPLTVDGKVDELAWFAAHNTADRKKQIDLSEYGIGLGFNDNCWKKGDGLYENHAFFRDKLKTIKELNQPKNPE